MHITPQAVRRGRPTRPRARENLSHISQKTIERMEQALIDLVNNFPGDGEEGALRSMLEPHRAKTLRSACVKLKLNPESRTAGTDNKPGYIDLLLKYRRDRADGELVALTGPTKKQTKRTERRVSPHDIFLLLNVLFSEAFVHRMGEADKNQTRSALDNHAINEGSPYWKEITTAYNEDRVKYKGIAKVRPQYQGIHPEQAVDHSTAKLMDMWKKLVSRYAVTLGKSHLSGHNENDFFSYCKGRVDLLYLDDWFGIHPGQMSKVIGRMAKKAQMSTLEGSVDGDVTADTVSSRAEESSGSKRQRTNAVERIADMLEEEHHEEMAERHSGYDSVTRASAAVQCALTTLKMLKDADASDEVVVQAQHKVDVLVKRWMEEMDPK